MYDISYIALMSNSTSFQERLQALRSKLNLSQEQLASRLNVSFATVNRWEAGKATPQKRQVDAVEKLLDDAGLTLDPEGPDSATQTSALQSRRRRGIAKSAVLSNKSMEQMLWDAACSVRGEKDAPKFKDYLLPLLFIKRLSDVFDDEIQRLTEQFGERRTALEVLEDDHTLVRFYLPAEARWPVVSGRERFSWPAGKEPKSLGEQLTTTIRAIVKHNPSLAGVIDIVDFNETRNGEREISDAALKGVIETFSSPRYRLCLHDVEPDFLGRCYEYLLRKFAEGQGQSAGEFFTPTEVGFLMAEILRPRPGEDSYDYACGSFGLLIKLQLVCRRLDPLNKVPLKLFGQELTGSSYAIACMNKIIHDMDGEILRGDSMRNPKFRESDTRLKKYDIVVANPMWNQPFDSEGYENDPFGRFEEQGGITTSKADWAWLQHTLASLKDSGRAAVVLDTGAVTRGSGSKNEDKERNIRKWFVEHDAVDGVILLPDNLFYNTTAAGIIIVLRKGKPKERRGSIVLVNASREFRKGTPKNYLTDEAVRKIAEAFLKAQPVEGFVAVITNEEATKNDFNLSPSRYVVSESEQRYRDIRDIVADLSALHAEQAAVEGEMTGIVELLIKQS
jgi:type I restriction enzyme M protein